MSQIVVQSSPKEITKVQVSEIILKNWVPNVKKKNAVKIIFWQMNKQYSTAQHFSLHLIWRARRRKEFNKKKTSSMSFSVKSLFFESTRRAQWTPPFKKKCADIKSNAKIRFTKFIFSTKSIKCRYILCVHVLRE